MIGSSDHRTIRSSDQRTSGSSDHRTIGPSDQRIIGSADRRTIGPQRMIGSSDHRTIGPSDHRISGSSDHRTIGPSDQRISGSSDQRISGSSDHRRVDVWSGDGCVFFRFPVLQLFTLPSCQASKLHSMIISSSASLILGLCKLCFCVRASWQHFGILTWDLYVRPRRKNSASHATRF